MHKLYDFQEEDVKWLAKGNALLANSCGTGKTLIAVEAAKRYARGPVLIICPRLVKEWWAETIRGQEAGYVGVCERAGRGIPWQKVATWGTRKPLIFVIVHPAAVRIAGAKLARVKWDMIIVDEAHRFKNRKAGQTKALKRIQADHKILMTATPYGRNPADMWALLHYLYPSRFRSYWQFYDRFVDYYQPEGQRFRNVKGGKNLKELARVVAPFYRKREKSDVLDLPPLTYTDAPVLINGKQEKLYLQLVKDAYAQLAGKEIIIENALVKFLRLQQCALDPGIILEGLPDYPLGEVPAKVEWLHEWFEDNPNEPVVITSRYRRFVEKWLRDIAPEATIVGGMSQRNVKAALRTFEKTGILVGTLDAIKEGMNLQRASTLIVTDGTWSPTSAYQLTHRIHRVGSTKPCQVIHLVAKLATSKKYTVDVLMRRALEKRWSDARLVDEFIRSLQ